MVLKNITPKDDQVVVVELKAEQESIIFRPDNVDDRKVIRAKVVGVGPGRLNDKGDRIPSDFSVGDTVYFKKFHGRSITKIDGVEYITLRNDDIAPAIFVENP